MGQPTQGIMKLYKNSIEKVVEFIKEKHQDNFLVVNLGNHFYDFEKFDNKVLGIEWIDHKPASQFSLIDLVFDVADSMMTNN